LHWRSWDDDEYVIYSSASGDTHLINEVTAEVLRQLERSALPFPDLVHNVAETLGIERDQQIETHVGRLLVYLDQIGLVEPEP
jgi:PqqD family protein of HPr-rel-A system